MVLLAGLFSLWIWSNQREQDRDMCEVFSVFLQDPPPPEGPAGDRGRAVQAVMRSYYEKRGCLDLR